MNGWDFDMSSITYMDKRKKSMLVDVFVNIDDVTKSKPFILRLVDLS